MSSTYDFTDSSHSRQERGLTGPRILVADHSPMFCHALAATLINQTCANVVDIVTSLAGLDPKLRSFRPSIVLLGLGLGRAENVSGRQVLEGIVRQPGAPKVIVLTEHSAPHMALYVKAAGAFAQFDKALESEALIQMLSQMIRPEAA